MKGTKVQTLGAVACAHVHGYGLCMLRIFCLPVARHADVKLAHAQQVDTPRLLAHAL